MGRNKRAREIPLTKEEFVEALMRLRELEEYGEWDEELEYERDYEKNGVYEYEE